MQTTDSLIPLVKFEFYDSDLSTEHLELESSTASSREICQFDTNAFQIHYEKVEASVSGDSHLDALVISMVLGALNIRHIWRLQ